MHARLREEYEVPVLTHDAIEVHVSYLRSGVEAIQAELPELRKEIKAGDEALAAKIDRGHKELAAADAALADKIDRANEARAAGDAALGEKIDKLSARFTEMEGTLKGVVYLLGGVVLISSGASIARTFGWI
jgi:phosphoenolpyruvate-protein kinase (PTS system EI component)